MKSEHFLYRSAAYIDLGQIIENYRIYKKETKGEIIAVVKANAYGHGDVEVARALSSVGVDYFAVSNIEEGIRLRSSGIEGKILVLGYTSAENSCLLSSYHLTQAVVSQDHLSELISCGDRSVNYHLALDLGMKRIGLTLRDDGKLKLLIKKATEHLKIQGIFSHLPVADSLEKSDFEYTKSQISKFNEIWEYSRSLGVEMCHLQNSAAGLLHKGVGNTRLGIGLYGYAPSSDVKLPRGVSPALSWKSGICRIEEVKAGESVGYSRSFYAKRDMQVATVMTGYGDGYPRALSNKGFLLVGGEVCRIVGRVCMDMLMIELKGAKCENEATLIGNCKDKKISADDIAQLCGRISYEILTGISGRVKRIYI